MNTLRQRFLYSSKTGFNKVVKRTIIMNNRIGFYVTNPNYF